MRQKVAPAIAKIAVFDRVTRNSANDRNSDLPSFFELEERRYNDEMTSQSERERKREKIVRKILPGRPIRNRRSREPESRERENSGASLSI